MSKKTTKTRKAVQAKSAAFGKIKKQKLEKKKKKEKKKNDSTDDSESTIVSKIKISAQNVKDTIAITSYNTYNTGDARHNQKDSGAAATAKNIEKNSEKINKKNKRKENADINRQQKGYPKNNPNQNKKQKKNPDATNKGKGNEDNYEKDGDGADNDEAKWSKSKKKRMRALKAKQLKKQQQQEQTKSSDAIKSDKHGGNDTATDSNSADATPPTPRGSKLQNAFKARLSGSRFRILNEELYTKDSKESFDQFSKNPELFEQYHEGFRHQVASWPANPVDVIVRWIVDKYGRQMKKKEKKSNNKNKKVTVADFGCGDAQLAKDIILRHPDAFQVYSFDLVSQNPELITACDMANVPLKAKSVDVVVFSLALMGTNLADFIREAHRVLKDNGRVQIAEVRSRIEYSHSRGNKKGGSKNIDGSASNDSSLSGTLDEFIGILSRLGFECAKTDRSNKMFLFLELKKNSKAPDKNLEFSARPCIYKRR